MEQPGNKVRDFILASCEAFLAVAALVCVMIYLGFFVYTLLK